MEEDLAGKVAKWNETANDYSEKKKEKYLRVQKQNFEKKLHKKH